MGVKHRLVEFLAYKNIGQAKFADIAGLSKGYVNNIVNTIGPTARHKIETAFPELNVEWLLTGKGEMLTTLPIDNNKIYTIQQTNDMTIDRLLNALERRDEELAHRGRQMDELIDQQGRLISVIETVTGTSFKQSQAG